MMKKKASDKHSTPTELELQHKWNNIPLEHNFSNHNNFILKVFSPGTWNVESGPDFSNAKISINGKIVIGAVEVHRFTSDWLKHLHNNDPAYRKVILHVVANDDMFGEKTAGMPPIFVLPVSIKINNKEKIPAGDCARHFSSLTTSQISAMLLAAGIERFYLKSGRILRQMLQCGVEKTCMQLIFEAAGYKKNRECFLELFNRFYEYPVELRKHYAPAIIWGESGLLPDPAVAKQSEEMKTFTMDIWRTWWKIRIGSRHGIKWRQQNRPVNTPARRVAAIVQLYQQLGETPLNKIIEQISTVEDPIQAGKAVINQLICRDPLWDRYGCFSGNSGKRSAVFGNNSALEMAVNAILPSIHAAAKINGSENKSYLSIWLSLPALQSNSVTKIAVSRWFNNSDVAKQYFTSAAISQGVIHLYQEYCDKCHSDCGACLIYNSI